MGHYFCILNPQTTPSPWQLFSSLNISPLPINSLIKHTTSEKYKTLLDQRHFSADKLTFSSYTKQLSGEIIFFLVDPGMTAGNFPKKKRVFPRD